MDYIVFDDAGSFVDLRNVVTASAFAFRKGFIKRRYYLKLVYINTNARGQGHIILNYKTPQRLYLASKKIAEILTSAQQGKTPLDTDSGHKVHLGSRGMVVPVEL